MKDSHTLTSLAALGWKLIPLSPRKKRPFLPDWPRLASDDEEQILQWVEDYPRSNWGVKLGAGSGIIDIECDDELAEQKLLEIFDNDVPVTPMYSARRGNHRLFKYRRDLPRTAVVYLGKLEIRIGAGDKGAQSVIPPSIHPDGDLYRWIVSPEECNIAEIPDEVLARIIAESPKTNVGGVWSEKERRDFTKISQGVGHGERANSATAMIGKTLSQIVDVWDEEAIGYQYELIRSWNERNEPPLDDDELESTFDSILRRERQQRTERQFTKQLTGEVEEEVKSPETPKGWSVLILMGKPRVYHLFSPLWSGHVHLSSKVYLAPSLIKIEVLEQKEVVLPSGFERLWKGDRRSRDPADHDGLASRLIEEADKIDVSLEDDRDLVVAAMVADEIEKAHDIIEGREPDGDVQRMPDGSIVFKFSRMLERLSWSAEKVTRKELSNLLKQVDAKEYKQRTLKRLTDESQKLLREMIS